MPIQPKFTPGQFGSMVKQDVDRIELAILRRFKIAGEEAVNYARSINTYKDRTGNLRSSIGYVIFRNGIRVFASDFNKVRDGAKGQSEGEDLANKVARGLSNKGMVLVVVAGMKYAFHVETKGYDVITGSEIRTKARLNKALKRIKQKLQ